MVFFTLMLIVSDTTAQNSRWSLKLGYEQVYVRPATTGGVAQKDWTWISENGVDEYMQWRSNVTQGWRAGIAYDVNRWFTMSWHYTVLRRRNYLWGPTNVAILDPESATPNQRFGIRRFCGGSIWCVPDKTFGYTMRTKSWQLGMEFRHKIVNPRWHAHYYVSSNFDQYRNDHDNFDLGAVYNYNGHTLRISADIDLEAENPGEFYQYPSANFALGISREMGNGTAIRFDFGLRSIAWTEDYLPRNQHFVLDAQATHLQDGVPTGEVESIVHRFPLYIGGLYANLSFVFRPFRSKHDPRPCQE